MKLITEPTQPTKVFNEIIARRPRHSREAVYLLMCRFPTKMIFRLLGCASTVDAFTIAEFIQYLTGHWTELKLTVLGGDVLGGQRRGEGINSDSIN